VAAVAAFAFGATPAGAIPEFEAPFREYPAGVEAISLAHGDFDEDGLVDAVVAISSPTADLVFMRQNADHSFSAAGSWTSDLLTSLVAGDFNGDGNLDVAGLDQLGNVIALFGDGAGGSPVSRRARRRSGRSSLRRPTSTATRRMTSSRCRTSCPRWRHFWAAAPAAAR
jgi:hypothetical protein